MFRNYVTAAVLAVVLINLSAMSVWISVLQAILSSVLAGVVIGVIAVGLVLVWRKAKNQGWRS